MITADSDRIVFVTSLKKQNFGNNDALSRILTSNSHLDTPLIKSNKTIKSEENQEQNDEFIAEIGLEMIKKEVNFQKFLIVFLNINVLL